MIWLNGTFGVGKSSTADELLRRIHGSRRYDPEEVGFLLRQLLPRRPAVTSKTSPPSGISSPKPQSRYTHTPARS
jgi:hypothetical protein